MTKLQKIYIEYMELQELQVEVKTKIEFEREWIKERQKNLKDLREFNRELLLKIKSKKDECDKLLAETVEEDMRI